MVVELAEWKGELILFYKNCFSLISFCFRVDRSQAIGSGLRSEFCDARLGI